MEFPGIWFVGLQASASVRLEQGVAARSVLKIKTMLRVLMGTLLLMASAGWARPALAQAATPPSSTGAKKSADRQKKSANSGTAHQAAAHRGISHGQRPNRKPDKSKGRRSRARLRLLRQAFVASSQLRPMAQQLQTLHTPAAYAGVERYARAHRGEAADAAYLALGNAYLSDQKYPEATASFRQARQSGNALADYAEYLEAKADVAQQQYPQAEALLTGFDARHPESILMHRATLLLAQVYIAEGDPQSALKQLAELENSTEGRTAAYLLTLAQARQMAGDHNAALQLYRQIYTDYANSDEATQAMSQLHAMSQASSLTIKERVQHAEGLARAGNYTAAAAQYQALAADSSIAGSPNINLYLAYAALYDYRQEHHVEASDLARLSDTNDEAGALRLYLMIESARDRSDVGQVQSLLQQMQQRFAQSKWTAEALFSAGNMAMVANDLPTAIQDYTALVNNFPAQPQAARSHWHAAWLTYRLGDTKTAAQLFEEQIARYPSQPQTAAAIYWRGRIYQDVEKNDAAAVACYNALIANYHHYYYAELARKQLAELQDVTATRLSLLARIPAPSVPALSVDVPGENEHVIRAGLLANAGLNQYIAPEIQASPDSAEWAAYAEAKIYASYGENFHALHALKRVVHSYFAVPMDEIPRGYWNLLFPQANWPALTQNAKANGLDPYLVVSLIRQESEFNPGAISYANAYGLMQLLPSVGRELAHKAHVRHFQTSSLLNPDVNLRLGTIYLWQLMDEFNGQTEYALAAYNAGDDRVKSWLANGPYADLPTFVESIPFTETREYVQAILRNVKMYRRLYEDTSEKGTAKHAVASQ